MIYQNNDFEKTQNKFFQAFKELQIGKLLAQANITKSCSFSVVETLNF